MLLPSRGRDGTDGSPAPVVALPPAQLLRHVFRRFWPYARPCRGRIVLIVVLAVAGPAVSGAAVKLFQTVVDEALVPGDGGRIGSLLGRLAALGLVGAVLSYVASVLTASVALGAVFRLRTSLFERLLAIPVRFFERRPLGDLLTRVGGDVGSIEAFVLSGFTTIATSIATLAVNGALMVGISVRLTLAALVVVPLFAVGARLFSRRLQALAREQGRRDAELAAGAEELLANVTVLQSFGVERRAGARFTERARAAMRSDFAAARFGALYPVSVGVLETAGGLGLLWFGVREIGRGELTPGGLLAFLTLLTALFGPIRSLGTLATTLFTASAGAERVIELLDVPTAGEERPGGTVAPPLHGKLSLESVSYRYPGAAAPVLHDVSLTIAPGEVVAVVGPSGSGKSTLGQLVLRLADPTSGRILVDGVDVRSYDHESFRNQTAAVFQESMLFDDTVAENIRLGRPEASDEEVAAAAAAADADGFVAQLPLGFATRVGQRGRTLSGGQRQRIALARAFLRDARIVVLDEPTTGLDRATGERVLAPMLRLAAGRTVLVISHDEALVRAADRVVVVVAGRVVASGPHAELLASLEPYRQLWQHPTDLGAAPQAESPQVERPALDVVPSAGAGANTVRPPLSWSPPAGAAVPVAPTVAPPAWFALVNGLDRRIDSDEPADWATAALVEGLWRSAEIDRRRVPRGGAEVPSG